MLPWWGTRWPILDCLRTFEWGEQDLPTDRSTSKHWIGETSIEYINLYLIVWYCSNSYLMLICDPGTKCSARKRGQIGKADQRMESERYWRLVCYNRLLINLGLTLYNCINIICVYRLVERWRLTSHVVVPRFSLGILSRCLNWRVVVRTGSMT